MARRGRLSREPLRLSGGLCAFGLQRNERRAFQRAGTSSTSVIFAGDEFAVPAQQCLRPDNRCHFCQHPFSEQPGFGGQAATLVVGVLLASSWPHDGPRAIGAIDHHSAYLQAQFVQLLQQRRIDGTIASLGNLATKAVFDLGVLWSTAIVKTLSHAVGIAELSESYKGDRSLGDRAHSRHGSLWDGVVRGIPL